MRTILVALLTLKMMYASTSADADDDFTIEFQAGPWTPKVTTQDQLIAAIKSFEQSNLTKHVLVQLTGYLDSEQRNLLSENGLTLLTPLNGRAFFARLDPQKGDAVLANPGSLLEVNKIMPEWKMDLSLMRGDIPEWSIVDNEKDLLALYIVLHPDCNSNDINFELSNLGCTIVNNIDSAHLIVAEAPREVVRNIAELDCVQWIEPPLPPLRPGNNCTRQDIQVDASRNQYGVDGSGVQVMILDTGWAEENHPAFENRLRNRDNAGVDQDPAYVSHSTHVAGIVGGGGNSIFHGMAPACTLNVYGWRQFGASSPGDLFSLPQDLVTDVSNALSPSVDVDLATCSLWSAPSYLLPPRCDWMGKYGVVAQLIDNIVRGNIITPRPLPFVWIAGNDRQGSCGNANRTIAPPGTAKNVICVGAVKCPENTIAEFSNFGPTEDLRIKPDLVAPGIEVVSTVRGGGYAPASGTSQAAPAVAGSMALILQDWRNRLPGVPDPLPSTYKALLIQTSLDLGQPGPDYSYGYGLVQVQNALSTARSGYVYEGEIFENETNVFTFVPDAVTTSLEVTLAWDDFGQAPNVTPALINDLDLTGYVGTKVYYPWTLDSFGNSHRDHPDHRNNVEQLWIKFGRNRIRGGGTYSGPSDTVPVGCAHCFPGDPPEDPNSPTGGTIRPYRVTIEVRGYSVPYIANGRQKYSLVASRPLVRH